MDTSHFPARMSDLHFARTKPPLELATSSVSSSDNDSTPSAWPGSPRSRAIPPYSIIGVSISEAQTRLLSPTTPNAEKAAAIREGGGYFSIPVDIEESNTESPSPETSPGATKNAQFTSSEDPVSETPTQNNQSPHYESIRRPNSIRRSSSTGSLSFHRALSTASSLGDDTRFENVRDQINNRFKAIKDSLQDSNFRLINLPTLGNLPSLPKMPNILQSSTKPSDQRNRRYTYDFTQKNERIGDSPSLSINIDSKLSPASRAGMKPAVAATHPYFIKALEQLTGDVIVLGGYRGSLLKHTANTETPHRRLWVPPISAALNITRLDLEVGLEDADEENMPASVVSDGMLTHIGPIDVSRRLLKRLRSSKNAQEGKLRVHDYGYDWRLSPHRLSKELRAFLEALPCNSPNQPSNQRGAFVIAHSLGGLITRHVVNQRPELFAGVVYAGTPQHCVNILGPIRNGDEVMRNAKILTAQVNFTVRTSFVLLPLDGKCFIDMDTKEELPVDFFNPNDWIKHRFSPCIEPTLPSRTNPNKGGIIDSISQIPRSVSEMMENIPLLGRRNSNRKPKAAAPDGDEAAAEVMGVVPHTSTNTRKAVTATCTLPRDKALKYLTRTLASVKQFKTELDYKPDLASRYPPAAVIYGKTEPTVVGARVRGGYDGISRADAYDSLTFGSGDGVVLARAAMLPDGYKAAAGGVVGSDRGHITLLGDLEAVGKCLVAVIRARKRGVRVCVPE
jgi:pimeloyl-ACP methyl ester carboxylesterase